ncbi:hypothetical protein [Streptomyces sp. NBC_00005]|uniref:hypothetical protein n=1 Tax=Streptomyces sp. NBC_00005 TaxID=2903609 RepID=UPI0032490CC8
MGYAIALSALLIAGAVGAVVVQRHAQRVREASGPSGPRGASGLDAEAEANRWLIRLGGSLAPPGARTWAGADETAGRALTDAAECHRAARALLAEARTAAEYERATRTAQEGLRHVRTAREALGVPDDGPQGQVRQAFQEVLLKNGPKATVISAQL